MLEVARGLLLGPKLLLIDEPSIGLAPLMVREIFDSLVLEQGQTWIEAGAARILADPRIAQLFLGGGLAPAERAS